MASAEKAAMDAVAVATPEQEVATAEKAPETAKTYIAKENCFFNGRYLKRGELILLHEKPCHASLIEYRAKEGRKGGDTFIDPLNDMLKERRIKAAMPTAFIK